MTIEDVEWWKECACPEGWENTIRASVTQPGQEEICTWVAAHQGARFDQYICQR